MVSSPVGGQAPSQPARCRSSRPARIGSFTCLPRAHYALRSGLDVEDAVEAGDLEDLAGVGVEIADDDLPSRLLAPQAGLGPNDDAEAHRIDEAELGEFEDEFAGDAGEGRLHLLPEERSGEDVEFAPDGDDHVSAVGGDVNAEVVGHAGPEARRNVGHRVTSGPPVTNTAGAQPCPFFPTGAPRGRTPSASGVTAAVVEPAEDLPSQAEGGMESDGRSEEHTSELQQ